MNATTLYVNLSPPTTTEVIHISTYPWYMNIIIAIEFGIIFFLLVKLAEIFVPYWIHKLRGKKNGRQTKKHG